MFRDMGFDHTALGVDTENATGALQLYTGGRIQDAPLVYRLSQIILNRKCRVPKS